MVDRLRGITEQDKAAQAWRRRDYRGKPGRLMWNSSSYAVFRHVVNLIALEEGKQLEQLVRTFHEGLTGKDMPPTSFNTALTRLSALSDKLVIQVAQYTFTRQNVLLLMQNISGDGPRLTTSGFLAVEQAVLALSSLYDAYVETAGTMPEAQTIKNTIDVLYKEIQSGKDFNASEFEATLHKLHDRLSRI